MRKIKPTITTYKYKVTAEELKTAFGIKGEITHVDVRVKKNADHVAHVFIETEDDATCASEASKTKT